MTESFGANVQSLAGREEPSQSIWRLVRKNVEILVPIQTGGQGPTLFCVHSVAGDVAAYYEFAERLGPQQNFYAVQVPNLCMVPAYVASIESLAERYVNALVALLPKGPFILAGFSAGAIIAFEMAQQLTARGYDVPLLIALDGAPSNSGGVLRGWDPRYLAKVLWNIPAWIGSQNRSDWRLSELAARVLTQLIFQPGFRLPLLRSAQTMHLGVMSSLLNKHGWQTDQKMFIRHMYDAMHAYLPRVYRGKVLSYETRTQPLFHLLQIGAAWRAIAPNAVTLKVRGKHGSFFANKLTLATVVAHLDPILANLRQATSNPDQSIHLSNARSFA